MHELAVTESIRDIAIEHARRANARRVTHLHLVIGNLSSVVDDSVQFYWDAISQGTIYEGARLTIPFGQSLAVVGLNGAGKTTLAKLLARL